jgi:UDP-N-acetylmuramoylalanine--D-glutamate ligase
VRELGGVRYINDSKATNTVAVRQSLSQFPDGSVIWLAGGREKGIVYSVIGDLVRQKCKAAFFFGEAGGKLASVFKPHLGARAADGSGRGATVVETMREALDGAFQAAQSGDVVLLSPACSSFDQFKSFEDRGDRFKEMVGALPSQ